MKLAQALTERSELQRNIEQLKLRLQRNAKVQEGEEPTEDPLTLLQLLDAAITYLEQLTAQINRTNNKTEKDGQTLTDLLAKRDCLALKVSIIRNFLATASELTDRYSKTEIRIISTVRVSHHQKELDCLCKEYRELDNIIQELNWTTELCE